MSHPRAPHAAVVAFLALILPGGEGSTMAGEGTESGEGPPVVIQLVASTHVQGAYKPCT